MRPSTRETLAGATPYGAPIADVPVRLNVNENPYPPEPAVVTAIASAVADSLTDANRYPDREALRLREAISRYVGQGVTPAQIWAANGSNEIMHQVFSAFGGPGRTALSFAPTYSMYPQYARDTHTEFRTVARAPDFSLDVEHAETEIAESAPAIVILASPNNPTGHLLEPSQLRALTLACEAVGGLLIVDEAYGEFADPDRQMALSKVTESPNLLVTRTLSKAFGLAGLRLGYAVGDAQLIDSLRIVRLPYHLSSVTQSAATVAVSHADRLLAPLPEIRAERDRMQAWAEAAGLATTPSQANFIYIGPFADRHEIWQNLLDQGVLVRESGPDGWLRVSVGRPSENDDFMRAMSTLIESSENLSSE